MSKRRTTKQSIGQKLWLRLYEAEGYDREASKIVVQPGVPRYDASRATKAWLEGMSRNMKYQFTLGLRAGREKLGITQQRLAEIADLTPNAVALIERGERQPNLDTAARLCWALDIASGVTPVNNGI